MTYKKILHLILILLPIVLLLPASFFTQTGAIPRKMTVLLLILLVGMAMAGYLYMAKKHLVFNQLMFLSIVLAVVGSVCFLIRDITYLYMPLLVAVMLIAMIIDEQVGIVMHMGLTVVVAMTVGHGSVFLIFYLLMGIVTALLVNYAKQRNKMLLIVGALAVISGLLHSLLSYAIYDAFDFVELLLAMGNSALTLIIVVGSLPLWESIFQVMTPLKLLEVANADHKLIQRLLIEAPGTYHHVQMVGNLAERGAKAIGANALLAKTGAIFHDVGKLKSPNYFIENQNGGANPHDEIAAEDSAKIIIEHVTYGVKLALEHRLPEIIIDFIRQHHGTSVVKYFYHKAQNYHDGVTYSMEQFQYDGPKPQTKEIAIVMLSDCVEAFVRSLSEEARTLEKIQWIIGEVIRQKFEEGQLEECPLQVKELKLIDVAFMQVYNGLYHERISYPRKAEA